MFKPISKEQRQRYLKDAGKDARAKSRSATLLLRRLADAWLWPDHLRNKPGAVIQRLSPEKREILKHLRSEDLQNVRIDW